MVRIQMQNFGLRLSYEILSNLFTTHNYVVSIEAWPLALGLWFRMKENITGI